MIIHILIKTPTSINILKVVINAESFAVMITLQLWMRQTPITTVKLKALHIMWEGSLLDESLKHFDISLGFKPLSFSLYNGLSFYCRMSINTYVYLCVLMILIAFCKQLVMD